MNERIDKISDIVVDEFHDALKNGEFIPDEFFERFAELIVKECADTAKHHVMNISTYRDADFVEKQIIEHFGIKEGEQ